MDLEVLKKKISSFRTEGGHLKKVSDEVLMELLVAWEHWTGPAKAFATVIGMNRNAVPKLIGKAKRLRREGHFPVEEFKEIKIREALATTGGPCSGIELVWENGKIIRFQQVEYLIDFLKRTA